MPLCFQDVLDVIPLAEVLAVASIAPRIFLLQLSSLTTRKQVEIQRYEFDNSILLHLVRKL